jgi:hypothetical protein
MFLRKLNLPYLKHLYIFLLTINLAGSHVYGMNSPETTLSEKAVFVYRFNPATPGHLNSFFVKEIARYNYLNLYTTQYSLTYKLEVQVKETPEGNLLIEPAIAQRHLEGDIFYENFDLSDVLMPQAFGFDLIISDNYNEKNHRFTNLKFNNSEPLFLSRDFTGAFSDVEFRISNITFNYDEKNKLRFNDRIKGINRFLAHFRLLEFNHDKSGHINPEDPEQLFPNFFRIYDLRRYLTMAEGLKTPFGIPYEYENAFGENQRKLNAGLRRLETLFKQIADTLNTRITGADFRDAARAIIDLQQDYLTLMNSTNHLYEPVFLPVINFFKSPDDWKAVEAQLRFSLLPNTGNAASDEFLKKLGSSIYAQYLLEADTLIATQKFNEAAIMVAGASTFCQIYPDNNCDILTFNKTAQAAYGIFDSYLRVAKTAMENNKPDFALNYLRLALDFQQQNSHIIISTLLVGQAFEELGWSYLENAMALYDAGMMNEACEYYTSAREIYRMTHVETYNDLIEKHIKKCMMEN